MISVIITTYKREPAILNRAIESILRQTYKDIEIIVVDDSPDNYILRQNVKEVVLDHIRNHKDINICYIAHEKNLGACAARNTGLKYAKGEYTAYLDDDDEWLPEKLEKQIKVMLTTDAALVYCGRICKNDVTGIEKEEKVEFHRGMVFEKLLYNNFIGSTSFPLIKTECIKKINGFDVFMQSAQDYDVWLRIAEKNTIDYIEDPLVIYHEHEGEQITSNPMKKISGLERLNSKYQTYLDADSLLWWRRNIILIPYYAQKGEYIKALKTWIKCIKKRPAKIIANLKYLKNILMKS